MGAIASLGSSDTRAPSASPRIGLHAARNVPTFAWDILAVALLGLAVYAFAIRSRLPARRALAYIGDPLVEEPEAVDVRA